MRINTGGGNMVYALEMKGIRKTFPGVVANDDVNIEVKKGSVLCLVGENGTGKSTLMNILYGLHQPDEGSIFIKGKEVHFSSSADAIKNKIGMVHQHFMLVPQLSVLENIIIGSEPVKKVGIDWKRARNELSELCKKYNMDLPLDARIDSLPVGLQQKVEILKILYRGADIIILDEPTAVLTPQETMALFENIESLTSDGKTIIFITHKLDEVMQVADHIIVMRRGKVVYDMYPEDTNPQEIAFHMVGRHLPEIQERKEQENKEVVVNVESLTIYNDFGLPTLKDINLELFKGQIIGIAGVSGNGQRELAQALTGFANIREGTITAESQDITSWSRKERSEWGISYIPEDRKKDGMCLPWSVANNIIAGYHREKPIVHGFWKWMDENVINNLATELIKLFDIRTPGKETAIGTLSGGNQQKVIVARETVNNPKVIIASEPTRGVDIGAINSIHNHLVNLRNKGTSIMVISSDLDEILKLSDRIAVLCGGEIIAVVNPKETTREELGMYMAGIKKGDKKNEV